MPEFPSLKASALLRVLTSERLNYTETRRSGSHRRLKTAGWPPITWAYHDSRTLSAGELKRMLTSHVGLEEHEARKLL